MGFDVVEHCLGVFFQIRNMFYTKVRCISYFAFFADKGYGRMSTSGMTTQTQGKHICSLGHCTGLVKWV